MAGPQPNFRGLVHPKVEAWIRQANLTLQTLLTRTSPVPTGSVSTPTSSTSAVASAASSQAGTLAQLDATIPAYSRLLQIAARSNERLRASSLYKPLLEGHSIRDLKSRPRREAAPLNGPDPALPDLSTQGGDY